MAKIAEKNLDNLVDTSIYSMGKYLNPPNFVSEDEGENQKM